ncbi:MAG: hypothetical protein K6G28_01805 [Acholeplasmatales bacterium]|nr:hypothetical protein [Acholeplasmatales bacterium]
MRKVTGIIRLTLYALIGLLLIIGELNELPFIIDNLNIIVGTPLLIGSVSHMISDFKEGKHMKHDNFFGGEFIVTILSVIILFYPLLGKQKNDEIIFICIAWGVIAILNGSRDFSHVIYYINSKKPYVYSLIESVIMVVLAIMLILDPMEHVKLHIIVLGIEFLIEALEVVIHTFVGKSDKITEE